jgi:lipopolysaccharide transport system permease protein
MYATPVIYPLSSTSGKLKTFLLLNPMTSIVESFKYSVFSQGELLIGGLIYSMLFSFFVAVLGIVVFNQVEKTFMDTV